MHPLHRAISSARRFGGDWLSAIQMEPWMMRTGTPRAVQATPASAPVAPRRPRPRRSR
jgi:hypothetical protein